MTFHPVGDVDAITVLGEGQPSWNRIRRRCTTLPPAEPFPC
ncbi:hypothetical protein [Pseudonocardia nigra]|nr:hypothetical protein [Pseudonocardia nigra]